MPTLPHLNAIQKIPENSDILPLLKYHKLPLINSDDKENIIYIYNIHLHSFYLYFITK